ncbi:MAG: T9SS type A sorting domain-containing protein [Aureispira sp.]
MVTKFYFLILFLLSTFILTAQTSIYHPFPSDTARWGMYHSETYYNNNGQVSSTTTNHYNEELRGDTTINGMVYSKVYSNNILLGGIRETANRQVWFYGFANNNNSYNNGISYSPLPPYAPGTEILLYDFSLTIGDTISLYAHFDYSPFAMDQDSIQCAVIGEDSLWLIDGSYRRMLEVEATLFDANGNANLMNTLYWVEGIGAIRASNRQYVEGNATLYSNAIEDNGLFGSVYFEYVNISQVAQANMVSCFFDNTTQYIGVNRGPQCSNAINIQPLPTTTAHVQVAPNPFQEQTTFTINSSQVYATYTLQVYNPTGQLVQQIQSADPIITLQRQEQAAGLYFYQLLGDETLLHTGKVVLK